MSSSENILSGLFCSILASAFGHERIALGLGKDARITPHEIMMVRSGVEHACFPYIVFGLPSFG